MMRLSSIAQSGLQAAQARLQTTAHTIANPQKPGADVTRAVVAQLEAKHSVAANVAVVKTADQVMGTLLDIRA